MGVPTSLLGLAALAFVATAGPTGARGLPHSPSERLHLFAACAGRLSAEIQHAWLVDPAAAAPLESARDSFADLTVAVLPAAVEWGMPASQALDWRVAEWAMQRTLLETASFSPDPDRALRAKRRAAERRAECDGLLLKGGA